MVVASNSASNSWHMEGPWTQMGGVWMTVCGSCPKETILSEGEVTPVRRCKSLCKEDRGDADDGDEWMRVWAKIRVEE